MTAGMEEEEFILPEISPANLTGWLEQYPGGIVLDVREPFELKYARLDGPRVVNVPMSDLARRGAAALPTELAPDGGVPVVVLCHHGVRSAQVTAWLLEGGWKDVWNLAGGIDAYARLVDPQVGMY